MAEEFYYFVPGQVVLHLKHVANTLKSVIEDEVQKFLKGEAIDWEWLNPGVEPFRIVPFPIPNPEPANEMSLVLVQFKLPVLPDEYITNVTLYQNNLIAQ